MSAMSCSNGADLDDVVLAHACTVHKAQGSEYPAVVIALLTAHFVMLSKNLLYTAVTRGKRLVVLVADPRALEIALRGKAASRGPAECLGLAHRCIVRSGSWPLTDGDPAATLWCTL